MVFLAFPKKPKGKERKIRVRSSASVFLLKRGGVWGVVGQVGVDRLGSLSVFFVQKGGGGCDETPCSPPHDATAMRDAIRTAHPPNR